MELITKLDRALVKVEGLLLALILVGMIGLAALQVLLRNIWDTGIDWADITVQNATLLLGLLGASVATSEGRHLNIDLLSRLLRGRSAFLLRVLIGLFAVYVCALLTLGGWKTFRVNYEPWLANVPPGWTAAQNLSQQFLEGSVPQWLTQLLLPIGFGLIGVHFALRLVRDAWSLATGRSWEAAGAAGPEGDALLDEMEAQAREDGKVSRGAEGGGAGDEADDAVGDPGDRPKGGQR